MMTTIGKFNEKIQLAENGLLKETSLVISVLEIMIFVNLFYIGRSIIKPIVKIKEDTRIIGRGNLDHKIGTDAADEIGDLSRAFDRMTEKLKRVTVSRDELKESVAQRKKAEQELQQAYATLERRVIDRTAELTEVNERLMQEIEERRSAESVSLELQRDLAHVTRVATMGELATSVAHELNQPLAAILSNAQAGLRFLGRTPPRHP